MLNNRRYSNRETAMRERVPGVYVSKRVFFFLRAHDVIEEYEVYNFCITRGITRCLAAFDIGISDSK